MCQKYPIIPESKINNNGGGTGQGRFGRRPKRPAHVPGARCPRKKRTGRLATVDVSTTWTTNTLLTVLRIRNPSNLESPMLFLQFHLVLSFCEQRKLIRIW